MQRFTLYRTPTWMMIVLLHACAAAPLGVDGRGASPPEARRIPGDQRVLLLAVSPADAEPGVSLSWLRRNMLERTRAYYSVMSNGKTNIKGDVKGWYRLPQPLEKYAIPPEFSQPEFYRRRMKRLVEDSLSAAEKDIAYEDYDHIILVLGVNAGPGRGGYGTAAYCANPGSLSGIRRGRERMIEIATRGGQHFQGGIVVVTQDAHPGFVIHDFAHALGGVANGRRVVPDLYDMDLWLESLRSVLRNKGASISRESYGEFVTRYSVYMGPWDILSRHIIEPHKPLAGLSSFTRLRMGWIGDNQVLEISPGESRAATLHPLAGAGGARVLRIPGPRGTHYLLENRQKVRGDSMIPSAGLLVLSVDEAREDGGGIVRVIDADPEVPDFHAATFGVGEGQAPSVRLPGEVAIEVLWQQGKTLTVMVTTPSRGPGVQEVSHLIRKARKKLDALPESAVAARSESSLSAAMEMLLDLRVSEARKRVASVLADLDQE